MVCFRKTQPICLIRYLDKKTDALTGSDLLKLFIEGKQSSNINMIQTYVPSNSKTNEMFYVEYRHDDQSLPLGFKFYKKSLSTKKGSSMSHSQTAYSNDPKELNLNGALQANQSSGGSGATHKKEIKGKKMFFKCFDTSLNSRLTENVKRLIEFIERAYKLKIKKFTPKYMLDIKGDIIFMGIKHLFIDLYTYSPYDIEVIRENKQITFVEFRNLVKLAKRSAEVKIGGVQIKLPQVIHQDDKKYSSTLYKKMRVEKCGGDFCDYEMLEKNSGPLAMRKNILEEYKKHFGERKEQLENIALTLPYEISNQLILRTREHANSVVEILLKNKIFSRESSIVKSQNYQYSNEDNFGTVDVQQEYPFMHKPFTEENFENLYKRIKICKSCFIIYSLTAKHFDEKLKKTIKKQQSHASFFPRTSSVNGQLFRPNTTQIPAIPGAFHASNGFNGEPIPEFNRHSSTAQAAFPAIIEKQNSQKNNPFEQTSTSQQRDLMKSTSGALFPKKSLRISTRNPSSQQLRSSITTRAALLPLGSSTVTNQQQQNDELGTTTTRISKHKQLLPNTRKDIEVNRLTLGFLNYDKLKDLYHEPQGSQKAKTTRSPEAKPSKKQVNLLEKPNRDLKRKDINADSYLLFKIAEDRKNLRKNINSDGQMRQALLNKLAVAQVEGQTPALIQSNSLYYNHTNFQHLRRLHKFKLASPINPFSDDLDVSRQNEIDINTVCQQMGYPEPFIETDDLEFLIVDENTAIPFVLLGQSPQTGEEGSPTFTLKQEQLKQKLDQQLNEPNNETPFKAAKLNPNQQPQQQQQQQSSSSPEPSEEVIVFLQDFFDSFMEYRLIFEDLVASSPNRKVLLLNLPGQAYSIFNPELQYPNYYQIEVIDRLLYKLDTEKRINTKTARFKFVGIGYGGFILQSFMVSAFGNLPHLGSLLLLNSFVEVDSILKDTLLKSLEIFETCPEGMEELSYNYFSVIVNSQALPEDLLELKMKMNPILNEGRCTIIRGCLASQFMRDRFEKVPVSCLIVHTLKNCVVNINQTDHLAKFTSTEQDEFKANLILKKVSEKKVVRKIKYINGGHSLLEEDVPKLIELISEFMGEEL